MPPPDSGGGALQAAVYSEDVVRVRNPVMDDPTTLGLVSRVYGDSDDEMQDEDSDDDVRPGPFHCHPSLAPFASPLLSVCVLPPVKPRTLNATLPS